MTYISAPASALDPVICNVVGDQLQLIPANNHHGNFSIEVTVYDDTYYGESNTLSSSTIFNLEVISVNDSPVLINELPDIIINEDDEFPNDLLSDLSLYFKDVDRDIMEDDLLSYTAIITSTTTNNND